jgi:hypothetical protein
VAWLYPQVLGSLFFPPTTLRTTVEIFELASMQGSLTQSKVKVMLCVRHPSGAHDQTSITVGQLRVYWCGAPSLTRVWFCCWSSAAQLFSNLRPTIHYCLKFETPPTWRAKSPYLSPRNRVAQLYPRALGLNSWLTHCSVDSIYSPDVDRIENFAINNFTIVAYMLVSNGSLVVACLHSHCIVMAVSLALVLSKYATTYTVVPCLM